MVDPYADVREAILGCLQLAEEMAWANVAPELERLLLREDAEGIERLKRRVLSGLEPLKAAAARDLALLPPPPLLVAR